LSHSSYIESVSDSALETACAALGTLVSEEARLEAELEALQEQVQASRETYEEAWYTELHARLKAAGLSWCTYCDAVTPADALADGFTVDWHNEGYDPVAFWRYTEWYRTCPDCFEKKTFKPAPAARYAECLKKDPGGPMWERDYRDQVRPRKPETLDALTETLGLPLRWEKLRELKSEADWKTALVVQPVTPGHRSRTSPLAERSK
jgi:hypothetical protein